MSYPFSNSRRKKTKRDCEKYFSICRLKNVISGDFSPHVLCILQCRLKAALVLFPTTFAPPWQLGMFQSCALLPWMSQC